ncbi:hypothetical protein MKEN_00827200 [Mycena kentingensis (nom. inval.)]|nr:hypothetical protein MKEN_00827200 [Mycena kentingensis (nom. inval.)]
MRCRKYMRVWSSARSHHSIPLLQTTMRPREYCCCAIPLINAGIYFALTEQLIAGVAGGVLSLATPSIVGASTPSFAATIFGIVCFIAAGVQVLGFVGVAREKPKLFSTYLTVHSLAATAAFSVGLAWTILSLTRHSTAKAKCLSDFFANASEEEKAEGNVLCEVFPWVQAGVMGGLWLIMFIMHVYLYIICAGYATGQKRDHAAYSSLDSTNFNDIAMKNRNDPYGEGQLQGRASAEALYTNRDYHRRQDSAASMSDVLAEPMQKPNDNFYPERQGSYPPFSQRAPTVPPGAHTENETPTPRVAANYFDSPYPNSSANIEKPPLTQAHPAEGSFGRKTPRLQKSRDYY